MISNQIQTKIPEQFIQWIQNYNDSLIDLREGLEIVSKQNITELYNGYKCLALWNSI